MYQTLKNENLAHLIHQYLSLLLKRVWVDCTKYIAFLGPHNGEPKKTMVNFYTSKNSKSKQ